MTRRLQVLVALLFAVANPALAWAQGGGGSPTGTIQGRVTDAQNAVLPGVTVTASSPALLGEQSAVTSDTGSFRFPAVPPGVYTVKFELPGFATVQREIQITLGFTATVNAELGVATLTETVTVSGQAPLIDTTATRVQQNFTKDQLESIPNARDYWALLAATPGVTMARIDVGGNRAGTQTGYSAYGISGQVRILVEGINMTEGTGSAGFYLDYGSLEEAYIGAAGQSAEMPTPGVQTQFLGRSGGNTVSGEAYFDWYNNSLVGSNLSEEHINRFGLRRGSNELLRYRDLNINVGGPIKKDKLWWHLAWRDQFNSVEQPLFRFPTEFETQNWNPSVKTTYQLAKNHKLIGYWQFNQKNQPTRLAFGGYIHDSVGPTFKQASPGWLWKGEWNGTLSDKLYVEARYGDFGYSDPRTPNSDEQYLWRDSQTLQLVGASGRNQADRDRRQLTGAATYFLDTIAGSHTFRVGAESFLETEWGGNETTVGGNIEHVYNNGRSSTVIFGIPTALRIGSLSDKYNGNLFVENKLSQQDIFINDTWALGRLTFNLGARWDRYTSRIPEQRQPAFTNGPVSVPAQTFPARTFFTWNSIAPRAGVVFDATGDGHWVVKAAYGLFFHNPGAAIAGSANPNQVNKTVTYTWDDRNGDRRYQAGEEGAITSSALAGSVGLDPGITQPRSHDVSLYLEHQLAPTIGARVGFVYKTEDNLYGTFVPGRSALNGAYSVPFAFTDVGVDGLAGTADDRAMTLLGVPISQQSSFPVTRVVMNVPDRFSRYKTLESSINKRISRRWSASVGGAYSWIRDFPESVAGSFPSAPGLPGIENRSRWDFKVSGSYDGPLKVRFSPLLRHQAGVNFARTISVGSAAATAAGAIFTGTVYAESANSRRNDNITVLDLRIDRTFPLAGRVRVRGFVDLFNITNSNAVETQTVTTGARFLFPTAVLPPRAARLGVRFLW